MTLGQATGKKSENLQLLRFLAAITVIFFHSFPLSLGEGKGDGELLAWISGGSIRLGNIAVGFFFLCGGYLIARSVERKKNAWPFFQSRLLRLLPPLAFVTAASIILGAFVTTLPLREYAENRDTWLYLSNAVMILRHDLPGVFQNHPFLPTVNGSLWTIPVEFLCYIACFILYKLGLMQRKTMLFSVPLVAIGVAAAWWLGDLVPMVREVIQPGLLFYIGVLYWVYRDRIPLKKSWAMIALGLMGVLIVLHFGVAALFLPFHYIVMYLCFGIKQCSPKIGRLGDYSYGIYLWGWVTQQMVIHFFGGGTMNPYLNTVLSCMAAIPLGMLTWRITEKGVQDALHRK